MKQLRLFWTPAGFGRYSYLRAWLFIDGQRYSIANIRGNKFTLLLEILKGLKFKLVALDEIETEIEDELAEVMEILFSLRGRFPKKYIKLKDNPKELLAELRAFRISNEMK